MFTFFSLRRERKAYFTNTILGQIVQVNSFNVHLLGIGEGLNVVLIHGPSGNICDITLYFAPELAKKYWVIMIDRPGLGHSYGFGPAGETIKDQVLLLRDAARFLGAEKPLVFGQSLGQLMLLKISLLS